MSRNANRTAAPRGRRKSRKSLYISLLVVAVIITLLWMEQIALLYVLGTLSVAGLLTVVALADLHGARRGATGAAPFDDAAAIGDGTAGLTSATAGRPAAARGPRKR